MLNLQILRICQILDIKVFLNLLDTICSQMNDLILLIDNEITGLFDLFSHNGIHF